MVKKEVNQVYCKRLPDYEGMERLFINVTIVKSVSGLVAIALLLVEYPLDP
jgi:hypothetical protein